MYGAMRMRIRACLPADFFNKEAFRKAMSVVFAHAAFLDAAQCFALLPIATLLKRTGKEDAAILDFDVDRQSATLTANRLYGSETTRDGFHIVVIIISLEISLDFQITVLVDVG